MTGTTRISKRCVFENHISDRTFAVSSGGVGVLCPMFPVLGLVLRVWGLGCEIRGLSSGFWVHDYPDTGPRLDSQIDVGQSDRFWTIRQMSDIPIYFRQSDRR